MNKQTLSYDEETRGKTVINHMGGVFLYNRPEQILEQYELEVKSISRGRDSYQCDTELNNRELLLERICSHE